jgi:hypothetical protein
MKYRTDETETPTWIAQTVSVPHISNNIIVRDGGQYDFRRGSMENHTTLFVEIFESPHVVIASKIMYLYAGISEFGKFAKKTRVPLWNNIMILKPKVKNISQQVDGSSVLGHAL